MRKIKLEYLSRVFLVLFGCGFALIILELSLALASVAFRAQIFRAPVPSIVNQNVIRVLCIGESTTAGISTNPYPDQLEQLLNSSQNKFKFKVINRGIVGTSIRIIASHIEDWISSYKPHVVIAMMGVNDDRNGLIYRPNLEHKQSSLEHSRLYSLVRFLWHSWRYTRILEESVEIADQALSVERRKTVQTLRRAFYTEEDSVTKALLLHRILKHYVAEGDFLKSAQIERVLQRDYSDHLSLGSPFAIFFDRLGEFKKVAVLNSHDRTLSTLKDLLRVAPKELDYRRLGALLNEPKLDIKLFAQAVSELSADEQDQERYGLVLAGLYIDRSLLEQAEELLVALRQSHPNNSEVYERLLDVYERRGKTELNPQIYLRRGLTNPGLLRRLAENFLLNQDYDRAIYYYSYYAILSEEIFMFPPTEALSAIASSLLLQGRDETLLREFYRTCKSNCVPLKQNLSSLADPQRRKEQLLNYLGEASNDADLRFTIFWKLKQLAIRNVEMRENPFPQAIQAMQEMLKIAPDYEALEELTSYQKKVDPSLSQAQASVLDFLRIHKDHARALVLLGELSQDLPNSESTKIFETALTLEPELFSAVKNLSHRYIKSGRPDAAFTIVKRFISKHPK